MGNRVAVMLVVLASLLQANAPSAQEVRGMIGGGMVSDLNDQRYPAVGGGVLLDLLSSWVSVGAQGEMMVSWPYVAGRGSVFGQVNALRVGSVRLFVMGGAAGGESAGPLFGGGVDLRPSKGRPGLRVAIEDYLADIAGFDCARLGYSQAYCDSSLHGGRPYTAHQLTVRAALLF